MLMQCKSNYASLTPRVLQLVVQIMHPILSKEDEDPEMLVEDDSWDEKEVEPENEDDPISDHDSDHNED